MTPEELAQQRLTASRNIQAQRTSRNQKIADRQIFSARYEGYDVNTGESLARSDNGIIRGKLITNGYVSSGDEMQKKGSFFDTMPHKREDPDIPILRHAKGYYALIYETPPASTIVTFRISIAKIRETATVIWTGNAEEIIVPRTISIDATEIINVDLDIYTANFYLRNTHGIIYPDASVTGLGDTGQEISITNLSIPGFNYDFGTPARDWGGELHLSSPIDIIATDRNTSPRIIGTISIFYDTSETGQQGNITIEQTNRKIIISDISISSPIPENIYFLYSSSIRDKELTRIPIINPEILHYPFQYWYPVWDLTNTKNNLYISAKIGNNQVLIFDNNINTPTSYIYPTIIPVTRNNWQKDWAYNYGETELIDNSQYKNFYPKINNIINKQLYNISPKSPGVNLNNIIVADSPETRASLTVYLKKQAISLNNGIFNTIGNEKKTTLNIKKIPFGSRLKAISSYLY